MTTLTACKPPNKISLNVSADIPIKNQIEVHTAVKLIDFLNGIDTPSDVKSFDSNSDNGHNQAWFFVNQFDTYTSHIKNWNNSGENSDSQNIITQSHFTLSNGILATYTEEEYDFPSLSWQRNHYYYDTSIKNPNQDNEPILVQLADSYKKQQIIDKEEEIKELDSLHYPKLPSLVSHISVGIKNDNMNAPNYHYTFLYSNEKQEEIFWIQIKKHSTNSLPPNSKKISLKNHHIGYYYNDPDNGGTGVFTTIDDYDYQVGANVEQLQSKAEILTIVNSMIN